MPGGRPTLLNDETMQEIVDAVIDGCTFAVAAGAAGICRTTFYNWRERGLRYQEEEEPNEEDAPYAEFLNILTRAKDRCARLDAKVFTEAARGGIEETIEDDGNGRKTITRRDWRAAESRLKRRFRDDWGDKQDHRHEGEVTVTRVIVEGGLDHIKPAEP
jgi:hypothetical protein